MGHSMLFTAAGDVCDRDLDAVAETSGARARSRGYQAALFLSRGNGSLLWIRNQNHPRTSRSRAAHRYRRSQLFSPPQLRSRSLHDGGWNSEACPWKPAGMDRRENTVQNVMAAAD